MFTSIRSAYGALGVMLFLIALYLVLINAAGTANILGTGGGVLNNVFRTLQGR